MTGQGEVEGTSRQARVMPIEAPTPLELARRLAHPAIRLPLAIALTDAEGYIRWINSAFTWQTGYPADEALGRNRLDLYAPGAPAGAVAQIRDAMAAGRPLDTEFQTRTRDGQLYWISCVVAPTVEDGVVESYIFAEEDITQRRRSADAARSAVQRAEALAGALREERELLANVLSTIPHVVF